MSSATASTPLLAIEGLTKHFGRAQPTVSRSGRERGRIVAVDHVDFEIETGSAVAIVGESGSGKTTLARCLLQLAKPTAGDILFHGQTVLKLSRSQLQLFRRQAQIVFQDPYASLDPRFTVQRTIAEPLRVHQLCDRSEIAARTVALLEQVGLSSEFSFRFRHELSGGEAQRVSIARALATEPRFLVLDEPTSALDASARLRVISLLRELRRETGMTYLVISHDLSIVRYLCDRVLVMYRGRIVEDAPATELFANPKHPYTQALLSATPVIRGEQRTRIRLRETADAPVPASGCPLTPRCPYATTECATRRQQLTEVAPSHAIACERVSTGELALAPWADSFNTPDPGERHP